MPIQYNGVWTPELEERAIDLRVNYELSWEAVKRVLGFDTKDQPRIKVNRLLAAGAEVPPMGRYSYDFSVLPPELRTEYVNAYIDEEEGEETGSDEAGGEEPVVEVPYAKYSYKFDGETYTFPVNGELVSFPKDTWEAMVADYSDHGGKLTCYEVAKKYGANFKVLQKCFQLYGHFKARPPATREAIAEAATTGDFEPITKRAIELTEARLFQRLERERTKALERRVEELERERLSWEEIRKEAIAALHDLKDELPRAGKVERTQPSPGEDFDYFAPRYDLHFGMKVWGELGWGADYDSDTAAWYLEESAREEARRILSYGGRCRTLYFALGGDVFHAFMQRTKRGTPLEREMPDRLVWRTAVQAVINAITVYRQVADRVVFILIPGNHDHIFAELLLETLALYYEGEPSVDVRNELGKRRYFVVGETLHLLDHGEEFMKLGPQQFASVDTIARVVGGRDFFRARKIVAWVGHTHHLEMKSNNAHMEIIRCPSFAHSNEHEEGLGFFNLPQSLGVRLDANGDIRTMERIRLSELSEHLYDTPSAA